MQKILKPDQNQTFDLMKGKAVIGKAFEKKANPSFDLKSVYWPKIFNAKSYLTGRFVADKAFWMGDFKYASGEGAANLKPKSSLSFLQKQYATKTVDSKTADVTGKTYDTRSVATRDFRGKEKDKLKRQLTPEEAANNGFRGELKQLKSIDDVRDLLNKNK